MNEIFKFPAFWGIMVILNDVLILFYSILFKIHNIRADVTFGIRAMVFKIFWALGSELDAFRL